MYELTSRISRSAKRTVCHLKRKVGPRLSDSAAGFVLRLILMRKGKEYAAKCESTCRIRQAVEGHVDTGLGQARAPSRLPLD